MKNKEILIQPKISTASVGEAALKCAGCPLAALCAKKEASPGCEQRVASEQEIKSALEDDSVDIVTIHGGVGKSQNQQRIKDLTLQAERIAQQKVKKTVAPKSPKPYIPPVAKDSPKKPNIVERFINELEKAIAG